MFLHASALNHPVAFALCNDQSPPLLSCSCSNCTTPLSHPHCCHPPFLITFTLFSLWQNEMGHSAAAAFQHYPHADIPHHKQCLIAVSVQACMCTHLCFSPWYFVVCTQLLSGHCWSISKGFMQIKGVASSPMVSAAMATWKRTKHTETVINLISSLAPHSRVAKIRR